MYEIGELDDLADWNAYNNKVRLGRMHKAPRESWYFFDDVNNTYYSPYAKKKDIYKHLKEGGENPTPKEITEFLNENPEFYFNEPGFFSSKEETEDTEAQAVALPAGIYKFYSWEGELPPRLVPFDLRQDKYIELEGVFNNIHKDLTVFLENEDFYRNKELMYKLGILLYGPPGCGKTVFIRKTIEKIVPKDSVTIFLSGGLPELHFIKRIKESLADRIKVFVFEELITACDRESETERLLNFLDGENSIDKSIILATTNYPEKLPGNIVDRPSRFDKLYEVTDFDDSVLSKLLEYYLDVKPTGEQLKDVRKMSIAAIKELSLLMRLHEKSFSEALKIMKDRSKVVKDNFSKPLGRGDSGFSL